MISQGMKSFLPLLPFKANVIWTTDMLIFSRTDRICTSSKQSELECAVGADESVYFLPNSGWDGRGPTELSVSKLCKEERLEEAIQVAYQLIKCGIAISKHTMHCLLQVCFKKNDCIAGRQVHTLMSSCGLANVASLEVHLIRLFASCGSLLEANELFNNASEKTIFTWDAIISANANFGDAKRALMLYQKMQQEGIKPSKFSSMCILKACTRTGDVGVFQAVDIMDQYQIPLSKNIIFCLLQGCSKSCDLEAGRKVLSLMIKARLDSVSILGDHLIRLFASCNSLDEANEIFRKVTNPTVYTWTAIISAHASLGEGKTALKLYDNMQQSGIQPNQHVYLYTLKACSKTEALEEGMFIHGQTIITGVESDVTIGNTLVDMYSKCRSLEDARNLFNELPSRDLVSWGAMITGYAQHGQGLAALELYDGLIHQGLVPSKVIFLCSLRACGSIGDLQQGRNIHEQIFLTEQESDVNIGSTLLDMYGKCGSLEEAYKVFSHLPHHTVVSWGALIGAYAQHGCGISALKAYTKMHEEGIEPNRVIFLSILKACSSIGASQQSRQIHDQIIKSGLELDVVFGSTLVDMYAKCESQDETRKVFDSLPVRNVVSWGALMGSHACYGDYMQAEKCFEDMIQLGLKPDDVILAYILTAYSHAGLLEKGRRLFKCMKQEYAIAPGTSHFNCMIDLLCRCGCLKEAWNLITSMPIAPDTIGWKALLNGCRAYGNVEVGRHCFDELTRLDSSDAAGYMLMSNVYADADLWDDSDDIQKLRKCASALKKPGTAWIECDNQVHELLVGGKSLPPVDRIHEKVKQIQRCIKNIGHMPQSCLVLELIAEDDKKDALLGHCENLTIALGLVSSTQGIAMHVAFIFPMYNCSHNLCNPRGKMERPDIFIMDAYYFHNLKDATVSFMVHS